MDEYKTDEEQIESLKKWWDENGRSTLIAVVVAISATLGWQGYGDYSIKQAEAASQIYDDLVDALTPNEAASIDETSKRTAEHLATRLKVEHEGSTYSGFAGLLLAKNRVENDDLNGAEEELRWVLANVGRGEVGELAEIRLARVLAAQGNHEQALKILDAMEAVSFPALVARAQGDIYMSTDRSSLANTAYQQALRLRGEVGRGQSSLLSLQVAHLNPVPAGLPAEAEAVAPTTIETDVSEIGSTVTALGENNGDS
ncbi:MAG: putative negative regulator of RcsB-dependent stress response [Halieaceae bacterium]